MDVDLIHPSISPANTAKPQQMYSQSSQSEEKTENGKPETNGHKRTPSGEPDLIDSDLHGDTSSFSLCRSKSMSIPLENQNPVSKSPSLWRSASSRATQNGNGSSLHHRMDSGASNGSMAGSTEIMLRPVTMSFTTGSAKALNEVKMTFTGVGARILNFAKGATPAMGKGDIS